MPCASRYMSLGNVDYIKIPLNAKQPSNAYDLSCSQTQCYLGLSLAIADWNAHSDFIRGPPDPIAYAVSGLALTGSSLSAQGRALRVLGGLLRRRAHDGSNWRDLLCSLVILREALNICLQCHEYPAVFFLELGSCLLYRYIFLGVCDELTEAIDLLRYALVLMPKDHTYRYEVANQLSDALKRRHDILGCSEDLDHHVLLAQEALALCPPGHRDRGRALNLVGYAKFGHYMRDSSQLDALDLAIAFFEDACELDLEFGNPIKKSERAYSLCNGLFCRFLERGNEQDLTRCIGIAEMALHWHPESIGALMVLCSAKERRYSLYGDVKDMEHGIQLARWGIALSLGGSHPENLSAAFNNNARLLLARFHQSLDMKDLNESIWLQREANALTIRPHHFWAQGVFNLSEALQVRALQDHNKVDLEEAIGLHDLWLTTRTELEVSGGVHLYYEQIAQLRRLRFSQGGEIQDLHQAIDLQEKAARLRPEGHRSHNTAVTSLVKSYRLRAETLMLESDSHKALTLQSELVQVIQIGQCDRARALLELALVHLLRFPCTFNVRKSLHYFCDALVDPHCSAVVRVSEGVEVLKRVENLVACNELDLQTQSHLLDAYLAIIQKLPQVAYLGLDVRARFAVLAKAPNLAVEGAICALRLQQIYTAVEILEAGRAVFWTQYLRLRTSFNELPEVLAEELSSVTRTLEVGAIRECAPSKLDVLARDSWEEKMAERRHLSERLDALVCQARSLPGFDRFMLPDVFVTLARAAQRHPVIVLLASTKFCGAILIRSPLEHPEQLNFALKISQLGAFNDVVQTMGRSYRPAIVLHKAKQPSSLAGRTSADALTKLWISIVQVVIKALGWQRKSGRARPRLLFCMTGPFSNVPIHAACSETDRCTNYFVPSYVPTLGAALECYRKYEPSRRSESRVILAAVPRPYKFNRLPGAIVEANVIRQAVPEAQITSIPPRPSMVEHEGSASCAEVLNAIPNAAILHLACHGYANAVDVLDSGFVMSDQILTVAALMELNLPNAFLAFLSACETAKATEKQPDQAIHLAATMLFTGFKSVIGTMWSMNDIDGPAIAKRVYQELFEGDAEYLDLDSIPYALDAATAVLRKKGLHMSRWAPYVHFGI